MGTPATPLYAIITYGYHEKTKILPNFNNNLLYYKRYINDIIGVWLILLSLPTTHKTQLNGFGSLQWNVEDLTTSTTFLDLTIQIIDHKIHMSTLQHDLNLYLYIPPTSAHPTTCFKGLIIGELLRYWNQNSSQNDFITITNKFISCLLQRGHLLKDLIPKLRVAVATIDNITHNTQEHTNHNKPDESLYIHWQFHPKDINKAKIH